MKLINLDASALNPGDLSWDVLNQFGEVTLYPKTESEELAIQRIGDHEIILVNKVPITENILNACPNIKMISVQATGYNIVDTAACARRGIPVCNVPDYGTAAVAQFTLALMLELCHRIGLHDAVVHDGKWCASPTFCFWDTPQMELGGKTLGIIGFGRIGQAAGRLAHAFGMRILTTSQTRKDTDYPVEYVDIDTLLKESDFVSLHCPLFADNTGMVNTAFIDKMKNGAFLINTARGGLLDEQAVADALVSGKLAGAAVDVVTEEPMKEYNPLLNAPNCIITPHIAWAPKESRQRLLDCCVENIRAFLQGKPRNVVNL
jgi:glycerate dehydrogenase